MISPPDPDALLVALVLCPGAYSRNRFFELYARPEASAVRRRASLVRSIVVELAHVDPLRRGRIVSIDGGDDGGPAQLTYVVSSLGMRRSTSLSQLELSIIRYAVSRRVGTTEGLDAADDTRERIETALCKLSPELADSARKTLENALFEDEVDEFVLNDVPCDEQDGRTDMCVFCKIVEKTIPAKVLFEDDDVFAFHDLNPVAPVHVLVIPKKHIVGLGDAAPEDALVLGKLLIAARRVAEETGIAHSGFRTVVNNGSQAGQSVFHLHVHVIGGRAMAWPPG